MHISDFFYDPSVRWSVFVGRRRGGEPRPNEEGI